LELLLRSLIALNNPNWKALIYISDPREVPPTRAAVEDIVRLLDDKRIIWSGHAALLFEYFTNGYDLLDQMAENLETDWIVFTNGDNEYLPEALDDLDMSYDAVALNFFSRHNLAQHYFMNTGCVGHSDLGAVVLKYSKWIMEGRKFADMAPTTAQDGNMFSIIQSEGWRFKFHDYSKIFFSHNPNPLNCKRNGGIYLQSPLLPEQICLSRDEAKNTMKNIPNLKLSTKCGVPDSMCLLYDNSTLEKKIIDQRLHEKQRARDMCDRMNHRRYGTLPGLGMEAWDIFCEEPFYFDDKEKEILTKKVVCRDKPRPLPSG